MSFQGIILIVDRDSELVALLSSYLTAVGYRVVYTNRVREALKKLSNQRFDYLVIDPELEPDNTVEIFDEVMRSDGLNNKAPVILSTFNLDYEVSISVSKRLNAILPKPYTLAQFAHHVFGRV